MSQLICHLFGDYVFQSNWMAQNKTKAWIPALVHATVYTLMFLFITQSILALSIVWGTHLLIDRFRLAKYMRIDVFAVDDCPFWLLIVIDNSWHLLINYLTLKYL